MALTGGGVVLHPPHLPEEAEIRNWYIGEELFHFGVHDTSQSHRKITVKLKRCPLYAYIDFTMTANSSYNLVPRDVSQYSSAP